MLKTINYIAAAILIFLGVAHTVLTPIFYKVFDLNSLWFAGAGLGFVFLGAINICRIIIKNNSINIISLLSNSTALIYCMLITYKLDKPQAIIILLDVSILVFLSTIDLKKNKN